MKAAPDYIKAIDRRARAIPRPKKTIKWIPLPKDWIMTKDKFYEEMDKGAEQARNHPAYEEEGRELAIYASHARLVKALEAWDAADRAALIDGTVAARRLLNQACTGGRQALAEANALTGEAG
jgi:hypothetical protein